MPTKTRTTAQVTKPKTQTKAKTPTPKPAEDKFIVDGDDLIIEAPVQTSPKQSAVPPQVAEQISRLWTTEPLGRC